MRTENDADASVEVYTKVIKAGRRTYYFDVKSTRNDDYYVTITESRKKEKDGRIQVEKQKLHLYKEDFEKFTAGLSDVIGYIKTNRPELFEQMINKPATATEKELSLEEEFALL